MTREADPAAGGPGDTAAIAAPESRAAAERRRGAWVTWSAIAEPGDAEAHALVHVLGPVEALAWMDRAESDPHAAAVQIAPHVDPRGLDRVLKASERWRLRAAVRDPERHLARAAAVGAHAIGRGEPGWPTALDDLGPAAPYCLWVRGSADLDAAFRQSVAVVGSRASTDYGSYVAGRIAGGLADAGWTVVSGGAFGIDIRAHRAALGVGCTIAVMAGGIDRLYPRANAETLAEIVEAGAVVSEMPPGYAPHRQRFLTRNRLIAAASGTVVVEAAHRSGALSTANHAAAIGRPVAAVPGPVTAASSAGCHRLIRAGQAVLVTDAKDVAELLGPPRPEVAAPGDGGAGAPRPAEVRGPSFATEHERRAYDALGVRERTLADVAARGGLTAAETRSAIGALELRGDAVRAGGGWRRAARND